MDDKVDDMITAIKATAELSKIAYDAFKEQGFSKAEALELTKTMVFSLMGGDKNDD